MKSHRSPVIARAALGLVIVNAMGLLSGCISYSSTGSNQAPPKRVELTGSHIPVEGDSAKTVAFTSATATSVYTQQDIERSGARDLADFMARIPFVRVHH